MPFSDGTLDFLFANRVADSRAYFHEHHDEYERLVAEPMKALVRELTPAVLSVDPLLIVEPRIGRTISRLNRDTRFTKDKSLYRDVVWASFSRAKYTGHPGLYFEISPMGLRYGCGWYQTATETMRAIRELILSDDKRFFAAQQAMKKNPDLFLEDTRYRRTRHPDAPEEKRLWLDQRSICVLAESTDFDLMFSEGLGEFLSGRILAMKPVYRFVLAGYEKGEAERLHTL